MSLRASALLLFAGLALAGCAAPEEVPAASHDDAAPAATRGPDAVIALVDSGINPYHVVFRDDSPRALQHPSTYLAGYPADAVALNLTLDAGSLEDALKADCETWASVEADRLYWFPGTRIVGGIHVSTSWTNFLGPRVAEPYSCKDAEANQTPSLVFGGSHGTMTASRAAGAGYGACPECLIVMVESAGPEPILWAADQPWIDVQSNSWGPIVPLLQPSGGPAPLLMADPDLIRAVEDSASRQPAFWATGNGAAFRLGVLGHPTQAAFHFTPSAIRVGGHDSGRVALWPGSSPHVVSDACDSWAAEHGSLDESTPRTGGGTSGATPFVAGLAAKVVREARVLLGDDRVGVRDGVLAQGNATVASGPLADGDLTVVELRQALFATADARPDRIEQDGETCEVAGFGAPYASPPVDWATIPDGAPAVPLVGYGAVTPDTANATLAFLRGEGALPERPVEDAFFEADRRQREATYAVTSQAP
ncbi:MAG TPA: S8/S53 family peptidase [Candidatus Thermoplasmatota archaeon]|nr:S8/S53 family peptidase [Candidatus Thermoplasmatota archaeon]